MALTAEDKREMREIFREEIALIKAAPVIPKKKKNKPETREQFWKRMDKKNIKN